MRGLQGDQVTLVAENSSMQIKTMARALQDGSFGDMIRLVNIRSGRAVQARSVPWDPWWSRFDCFVNDPIFSKVLTAVTDIQVSEQQSRRR